MFMNYILVDISNVILLELNLLYIDILSITDLQQLTPNRQ